MKHQPYNTTIAFRITENDKEEVDKICNTLHITKSKFLRRACITTLENVHGNPDVLRTNKIINEPGIERN